MVIPVEEYNSPERRAQRDLMYNANSKDYINEKGFKQKYIDLMYKLGYYKTNETVFSDRKEKKHGDT